MLTSVVRGDVLQKAILLLIVWAAAYGAARLVPAGSSPTARRGRLVAATVYAWNAYVAERLIIGHWSLADRLRVPALGGGRRAAGAARRAGRMAGAGAGVRARRAGARPAASSRPARRWRPAGVRRLPGTLGLAVALNAPWWLPGVLARAPAAGPTRRPSTRSPRAARGPAAPW